MPRSTAASCRGPTSAKRIGVRPTGRQIEALSATPLDVARPETWLKLAERIGDSIAHDHVATIVLAGWPGHECEYFDDLRRAAAFGPVLGKLVTLEEYFRVTREPDDWIDVLSARISERRSRSTPARTRSRRASTRIAADVPTTHDQLGDGPDRDRSAGLSCASSSDRCGRAGRRSIRGTSSAASSSASIRWTSTTLAATRTAAIDRSSRSAGLRLSRRSIRPSVAPPLRWPRSCTLRNERLELTVSETTGGIQSLRTHRDRSTRVSQRLVFTSHSREPTHDSDAAAIETQMVADRVEITRNDDAGRRNHVHGRLLDASGELLAQFTQRVRVVRGLPAVIVDVELEPQQLPEGDMWKSYFASRLAWAMRPSPSAAASNGSAAKRPRAHRVARVDRNRRRDRPRHLLLPRPAVPSRAARTGSIRCCSSPARSAADFNSRLGSTATFPAQAALALLTGGQPCIAEMAEPRRRRRAAGSCTSAQRTCWSPTSSRWLRRAPGIRVRLLETEGRETHERA